MNKNAWRMPNSFLCMQGDLEKDNGHLLVLVLKRNGTASVKTVHKENGTIWRKECCWNSQKADVQFSALRVHCPEVDSEAKDMPIHYAADLETIETIFRIIVSANQLSLHGAIAEICEEYETLHERTGRPVVETSVIQARSSEDSKDPNVGKAHERTRRLVIETNTENVPDSSQTRSCHESETFNAGDKTLRERTVRPVVDHDNLSHEQTMLNEANMDFRIPGLPHSVVKHAQSTSVRELVQKIENHPSDTLFNKIYDKIKHITHLAQNQRK